MPVYEDTWVRLNFTEAVHKKIQISLFAIILNIEKFMYELEPQGALIAHLSTMSTSVIS